MAPILDLRKVCKSFGSFRALNHVDFALNEGEVVAIVGPSGSGKSTLLRCMNMLELIDSGEILFRGKNLGAQRRGNGWVRSKSSVIQKERRNFGMVFQQFNLFPNMTALDNVMSGPLHVKKQRVGVREEALELLRLVGLSEKVNNYPNQLSGGQQQRVAIARALAMKPEIMLFDEPTSALDPELVGEVLEVIRDLASKGMTMVVVTHEMAFARRVAGRLVFMDEGTIVEQGDPKTILDTPSTERARRFFSSLSAEHEQTALV